MGTNSAAGHDAAEASDNGLDPQRLHVTEVNIGTCNESHSTAQKEEPVPMVTGRTFGSLESWEHLS